MAITYGMCADIARNKYMKYFVYSLVGVVIVVAIAGIVAVGSPQSARRLLFDAERINHLSQLQYDLLNYWQAKDKLPSQLDELNDEMRGVLVPVDPETSAKYEYRAMSEKSFELCATFSFSSGKNTQPAKPEIYLSPMTPFGPNGGVWNHEAGRSCFSRTIDPDFFKAPLIK